MSKSKAPKTVEVTKTVKTVTVRDSFSKGALALKLGQTRAARVAKVSGSVV